MSDWPAAAADAVAPAEEEEEEEEEENHEARGANELLVAGAGAGAGPGTEAWRGLAGEGGTGLIALLPAEPGPESSATPPSSPPTKRDRGSASSG